MKIDSKDLLEKVKEYETFNEKEFEEIWNEEFSALNEEAWNLIEDYCEEYGYKMKWKEYKRGGYYEDPDYKPYKSKWKNFLRYNETFYDFYHPIKEKLWNSGLWYEAILMAILWVFHKNKKIICEYCKKEIKRKKNGFSYCTLHHIDYDIENPFLETILVHTWKPNCHSIIHGFKEGFEV